MKQNDAKQLKAGTPGKLRALITRCTLNPALMIFLPTNGDLHIDNAAIDDHNSTAPTAAGR